MLNPAPWSAGMVSRRKSSSMVPGGTSHQRDEPAQRADSTEALAELFAEHRESGGESGRRATAHDQLIGTGDHQRLRAVRDTRSSSRTRRSRRAQRRCSTPSTSSGVGRPERAAVIELQLFEIAEGSHTGRPPGRAPLAVQSWRRRRTTVLRRRRPPGRKAGRFSCSPCLEGEVGGRIRNRTTTTYLAATTGLCGA